MEKYLLFKNGNFYLIYDNYQIMLNYDEFLFLKQVMGYKVKMEE